MIPIIYIQTWKENVGRTKTFQNHSLGYSGLTHFTFQCLSEIIKSEATLIRAFRFRKRFQRFGNLLAQLCLRSRHHLPLSEGVIFVHTLTPNSSCRFTHSSAMNAAFSRSSTVRTSVMPTSWAKVTLPSLPIMTVPRLEQLKGSSPANMP